MDRFWAKVDIRGPDECWEWQAGLSKSGYGVFHVSKQQWRAHRFSWFLSYGPIPIDKRILHSCDNRPCVNLSHLFLGTDADNIFDMMTKGRHRAGHHGRRKLTEQQVAEIRSRRSAGEIGRALAKEYGITPDQIYRIFREKSWK